MVGWSEEEKGEEILFYFFYFHNHFRVFFSPSSAHTEKDMKQVYLASFLSNGWLTEMDNGLLNFIFEL